MGQGGLHGPPHVLPRQWGGESPPYITTAAPGRSCAKRWGWQRPALLGGLHTDRASRGCPGWAQGPLGNGLWSPFGEQGVLFNGVGCPRPEGFWVTRDGIPMPQRLLGNKGWAAHAPKASG